MEKNHIMKFFRRLIKKYIWKYILLRKISMKKVVKLNLGVGNNTIRGWLNSDIRPRYWDILFLDVRKKFPFKNQTIDCILSEHLIEHLSLEESQKMLRECFRVLKKGGRYLVTPSE